MDTTLFIQQVINGLVAGMSYVLIATGLTLVFGLTIVLLLMGLRRPNVFPPSTR